MLSTYAIPRNLASQRSNGLGVTGFDGEWANQADLTVCIRLSAFLMNTFLTMSQTFLQQFRPDLTSNAATHFLYEHIDGGQNPQEGDLAGIEAVSVNHLW